MTDEGPIMCPNCNVVTSWDGIPDASGFVFGDEQFKVKCNACGRRYLIDVAFKNGSWVNMMKEIPA